MGIDTTKIPLSVGIYSYADAARLTDTSPRELRRWLEGYDTGNGRAAPLWETEHAENQLDGIGFRDLLEVRLVREFRAHGLSLQAIREAARFAREEMNAAYPFTCEKFQTDGRRIFATVLEQTGEKSLVDIAQRQNVFVSIVRPSLYASVDFNAAGGALRWFPVPKSRTVVVDPTIAFGRPVLADYGIPVVAISDALSAEHGKADRVARMFNIPRAAVLKANAFARRVAAGI